MDRDVVCFIKSSKKLGILSPKKISKKVEIGGVGVEFRKPENFSGFRKNFGIFAGGSLQKYFSWIERIFLHRIGFSNFQKRATFGKL